MQIFISFENFCGFMSLTPYEILSKEDLTRLKHQLAALEEVVCYSSHPTPKLRDRVIELDQQYMKKRDELLGLFEAGELTLDSFCARFRDEAAPLFQKSHQLYKGMEALIQFLEDPRI